MPIHRKPACYLLAACCDVDFTCRKRSFHVSKDVDLRHSRRLIRRKIKLRSCATEGKSTVPISLRQRMVPQPGQVRGNRSSTIYAFYRGYKTKYTPTNAFQYAMSAEDSFSSPSTSSGIFEDSPSHCQHSHKRMGHIYGLRMSCWWTSMSLRALPALRDESD